MKAYGSFDLTPIPLPIADVLTGLQTGLMIPLVHHHRSHCSAMAYPSATLNLPLYVYGSFVITERVFKRLSEAEQQIVTEELTAAVKGVDRVSREDNEKAAAARPSRVLFGLILSLRKLPNGLRWLHKRTPS